MPLAPVSAESRSANAKADTRETGGTAKVSAPMFSTTNRVLFLHSQLLTPEPSRIENHKLHFNQRSSVLQSTDASTISADRTPTASPTTCMGIPASAKLVTMDTDRSEAVSYTHLTLPTTSRV